MSTRNVLVIGATGNQGGAVIEALLEKGMTVRALVRDLSSPKAQALAERSVELVQGNLEQEDTVQAAANGVDAVFVVTTPYDPDSGIEGEIHQGHTVIDALKKVNVPHVVYSSVSDANRLTGIPHFDSKANIELYLEESGLPATITAPVYFAENLLSPFVLQDIKKGKFRQALPENRKLQLVSLHDIGHFNATIIERGPDLSGLRINYAGDELTSTEMCTVLTKAIGRKIDFEEQPIGEVRAMSEDFAKMYQWFNRVGYSADIVNLRRDYPEVGWMSFEQWANNQDWQQLL